MSGMDGTLGTFPSLIDGSLQLSKRYLTAASPLGAPRGEFPGAYHVPQSGVWDSFKQLDKVPGAGALAGRVLQAVVGVGAGGSLTSQASSVNTTGVAFIDITGPWRN
ncbi:hypothetical protein D3C87_1894050 [compost metagenome]